MKRLPILLLPLFAALPGMAQEQGGRTIRIDDIVVTAKRAVSEAGVTRTAIDSIQLKESADGSLAELLAHHSPVFIKSYGQGSLATVSFRGTAASHTQVEWNGININNPMSGQVDFSLIPVWFVDRAELLHGGSSLQEGSGALGGSVLIASRPRWGEKYYGSAVQSAGSYGTYQSFLSAGGGSRKIQAQVRGLYEQAENDFSYINTAGPPPFKKVRQQHADYRKSGAMADLFGNPGRGNFLSAHFWGHWSDRNLPPIMSYEGKGRDETQQDQEIRGVIRWNKYWKRVKSELTSGFSTTRLDYYLANQTDMGEVVNNDSRSRIRNWSNKYKVEWEISERTLLKTVLNADYSKVSILNRITQEGYDADEMNLGLSASLHHRFSRTFSGYVLLRQEYDAGKYTPFMPSVGVEAAPFRNKNIRLRINGTRNYHLPTLNDRYWLPGGNPDLKPERGYSADLAAEYEFRRNGFSGTVSLTGYASWIDDWIIWRPSDFRYWTAENIKKVFARGLEANLRTGWQGSGFAVTLHGNYAFTRTTNREPLSEEDESVDRQLIYIPVHKANLMLDASWKGFYFYYLWSFTGERYTTSSNETTRHTLPAYDLHNLTLGKKLRAGGTEFDLQLKINNLFDKNYQAILWRAMPGRNYLAVVKFSF